MTSCHIKIFNTMLNDQPFSKLKLVEFDFFFFLKKDKFINLSKQYI